MIATLGCASSPSPARYPMWEPLSPLLPAVPSSEQGRRWLEQSREVWRAILAEPADYRGAVAYTPQDAVVRYSYVRAFQRSREQVEFTALSVEDGKVVLRALLVADPTRLSHNYAGVAGRYSVTTSWIESGVQVGSRDDGAPALTIEALHDRCESLLVSEARVLPRLYFHPDGVLMSCGYLAGECEDCANVSIQSFSRYPLFSRVEPALQLCTEPWGLFPPLANSFLTETGQLCQPAVDAVFREPRRALEPGEEELVDICEIDPLACPRLDKPRSAGWMILPALGLESRMSNRARAPVFLDFGKRTPLTEWSFPFTGRHGVFRRRAYVPSTRP
jgi:hypothetical protein